MATTVKTGIKATSIKAPLNALENHTTVLQQLKETTEIAQRLRGDPGDSFVRVSELVAAGLIRLSGGVIQPASSNSASGPVSGSRLVATTKSLTGGGDLSADRTLSLVNDDATPGASKYYGTDAGGVKGFFTVPTATAPPASGVSYSNTLSGLTATNVQDAIDQIVAGSSSLPKIDGGGSVSVYWLLQNLDCGFSATVYSSPSFDGGHA